MFYILTGIYAHHKINSEISESEETEYVLWETGRVKQESQKR